MKFQKQNSRFLIGAVITCLMMSACVDSGYDLSKDINLDISVGAGGVGLPLGNTEPIHLTELIDTTGNVLSIEDGIFKVKKMGKVDETTVTIDPVRLQIETPVFEPVVVDFSQLGSLVPNVSRNQQVTFISVSTPFDTHTKIDISQKVPNELKVLRTAYVQSGTQPKLHLKVCFPADFAARVPNLTLENFRFVLPKFLVFDSDKVIDGVLTVNKTFATADGFSEDLVVKGMDFSYLNAGKGLMPVLQGSGNMLILQDTDILLSGVMKSDKVGVSLDLLQHVTITPSITMDAINLGAITGYLKPIIDPIQEIVSLDLGDDLDFLREDAVLDLANPQIKLRIANTMGVPIDLKLQLSGKDKDGKLIANSAIPEIPITVKAASEDGVVTYSNFILSRKGTQLKDYEAVTVPTLSNLMTVIPDQIALQMNAEANQNTLHHVNLSSSVQKSIFGDYDVEVPFEFRSLNINYTETVKDLHKDLKDISDTQDEVVLELSGSVKNTVPADLKFSVSGFDVAHQPLAGITSSDCTIAAGAEETPVVTPILLRIKAVQGSLPKLDQLDIKINGTIEGNDGVALKESQYVQMNALKVRVVGGIKIDLNK